MPTMQQLEGRMCCVLYPSTLQVRAFGDAARRTAALSMAVFAAGLAWRPAADTDAAADVWHGCHLLAPVCRIHKRLIDLHSPADVVKQITSIR